MRVLIVGGGGREHALAWKLRNDHPGLELHAAPGNPGIAETATCQPVSAGDVAALASLADSLEADLVVVGPEAPLAAGLVDRVEQRGIACFGPSAAGAQIEASKRFSKELMLAAGVPTAGASWHKDVVSAKEAARRVGPPVVVKASGLAAGKGVSICGSMEEADSAIDAMISEHSFGEAGDEVLIEEFLTGEEVSVFAMTDGENFATMLPAQDHKRLLDGDRGPNTGGMGAYAPVSIMSDPTLEFVSGEIIDRILWAMRARGTPFRGLLYCGLMLTPDGPKVVEFNCRFGDPETQVVIPLLTSDLLEYMLRCSRTSGMRGAPDLTFSSDFAVTTVLAAEGYPDHPTTGAPIRLPEPSSGAIVFHAGTKRAPDGSLVTSGGRVLAVTGVAESFETARTLSQRTAERVEFEGKQFRTDIGWRELARHAGAS